MLGNRHKFSTPHLYFVSTKYKVTEKNSRALLSWFKGQRVILSRGLCNYECFELPPNQSRAITTKTINLQVKNFSAFESTGVYIKISGNQAAVWSWDSSPLRDHGILSRHCIPETVLNPVGVGYKLVTSIDGYEGQYWQNDSLKASRWWTSKPSTGEWSIFVSSTEKFKPNQDEVKAVTYVDYNEHNFYKPIQTSNSKPLSEWITFFSFRELSVIVGTILLSPFIFQASRLHSLKAHSVVAENEVMSLKNKLGTKQTEISRIQKLLLTYDTYNKKLSDLDISSAISDVANLLTPLDVDLLQLELSDTIFTITFKIKNDFDRVKLVKNLEASRMLKDVSISPSRASGQWTLKAQLTSPTQLSVEPS